MAVKYIFVLGGVVSGLGKGITAASLGRLLKARGHRVSMAKFDPYLNVDPGTMNPIQHGEVFVTDDGAETDLDLGHYERFIDESLNQYSNVTSGKVYWAVISKERAGDYAGNTVQVVPHITNEIKDRMKKSAEKAGAQIALIEIGGTVGDIESLPFLEAARQMSIELGRENSMFIYVTLIPRVAPSGELKTKPTQHSVKELLSIGIQPDIIVPRCDTKISREIRDKISLFCNVPPENVIPNIDVPFLYEAPLMLEREGLAEITLRRLNLPVTPPDLSDWEDMVGRLRHHDKKVKIALVGKYVSLQDAYISVVEALKHGGIYNGVDVEVLLFDSELITEQNVENVLAGMHGIIVPGGFGSRGIDGMITAAGYARRNNTPYFGICFGMHVACIEIARGMLGFEGAHSTEIYPDCSDPVIDLLPEQKHVEMLGATMRLGSYPCSLAEGSIARECYGEAIISERHRHRFEFNNAYREAFEAAGVRLTGISPDGSIVEMIEITAHPWFVAGQFHPEFKSRPNRPHPLFCGFIKAAEQVTKR